MLRTLLRAGLALLAAAALDAQMPPPGPDALHAPGKRGEDLPADDGHRPARRADVRPFVDLGAGHRHASRHRHQLGRVRREPPGLHPAFSQGTAAVLRRRQPDGRRSLQLPLLESQRRLAGAQPHGDAEGFAAEHHADESAAGERQLPLRLFPRQLLDAGRATSSIACSAGSCASARTR